MPAPAQQKVTIEELNQVIYDHMEARDWHKNPTRGLAISLALEANELLEHYQWSDAAVGGVEAVGEELADVLIFAIQIAQRNHIDIVDHIYRKLEKANVKYPPVNFKGKSGEEKKKAWMESKLNYRKDGL